jgi:uncharacterized protein (UPF0335 family)
MDIVERLENWIKTFELEDSNLILRNDLETAINEIERLRVQTKPIEPNLSKMSFHDLVSHLEKTCKELNELHLSERKKGDGVTP